MELIKQQCHPISKDTPALQKNQYAEYLEELQEAWSVEDGVALIRRFEFNNFAEALHFVNAVGDLAETEQHHPEIFLHDYKMVDIMLSTHSVEGLSLNDFIVAAKIDQVKE